MPVTDVRTFIKGQPPWKLKIVHTHGLVGIYAADIDADTDEQQQRHSAPRPAGNEKIARPDKKTECLKPFFPVPRLPEPDAFLCNQEVYAFERRDRVRKLAKRNNRDSGTGKKHYYRMQPERGKKEHHETDHQNPIPMSAVPFPDVFSGIPEIHGSKSVIPI